MMLTFKEDSLGREPLLKGRISTIDLLVLTSLDQLLLKLQALLTFYETRYLNEEVNCAEPSPSVSVPWFGISTRGRFVEQKLVLSRSLGVTKFITIYN